MITLNKKILFGYALANIMLGIVIAISLSNIYSLGKASNAILKENYISVIAAQSMMLALENQNNAVLFSLLNDGADGFKLFHENEKKFMEYFIKEKNNITLTGEAEKVNELDALYSGYLRKYTELNIIRAKNKTEAVKFYHVEFNPIIFKINKICGELSAMNQANMYIVSEYAQKSAKRSIMSLIIIGIIFLVFGFGFSLIITNYITRPLKEILASIKKVAAGDYDAQINTISKDELGIVACEFNDMIASIKNYRNMNIDRILLEKSKNEEIINCIDDGIILVDPDFKITDINPVIAKMFNIDIRSIYKKHFLEIVKDERLYNFVKLSFESKKKSEISESENIFSLTCGDKTAHYQFSIMPLISSEAEKMFGVIILFRDITKYKELNRLKTEFIMKASHELKNPLTSLCMSVELLKKFVVTSKNEQEKKLVFAAYEDAQRFKNLVEDLLNISKIEAGKLSLDFESVPVSLLFEKAYSIFNSQAREKNVEIKIAGDFKNIPNVKADINKIMIVISNLISNALRYCKDSGVIILSAEIVMESAHISIRDNGIGIPFENQSKIFNKYIQLKDEDFSGGSLGLGLALCREIVNSHGGAIWVESVPGEGSVFVFTLPVYNI